MLEKSAQKPVKKRRWILLFTLLVAGVCLFAACFRFKDIINIRQELSGNWSITGIPHLSSRIECYESSRSFGGEGNTFEVIRDNKVTDLADILPEDVYMSHGKEMRVSRGESLQQPQIDEINQVIGLLDPWRVWITEGFEPAWDMVYFVIDDEYIPDYQQIDAWLAVRRSDGSFLYLLQDVETHRLYLLERYL